MELEIVAGLATFVFFFDHPTLFYISWQVEGIFHLSCEYFVRTFVQQSDYGDPFFIIVLKTYHICFQLFRSSGRSEEHTSELQSLMRTSYAVFCLKKNNSTHTTTITQTRTPITTRQGKNPANKTPI